MNSINDWSEFLLWAEKNLKDMEKKILHNTYDMDEIRFHAACIKESIDKTVLWAENAKQK